MIKTTKKYFCDLCGSEMDKNISGYRKQVPMKYFMDMTFGIVVTANVYGQFYSQPTVCKNCIKQALQTLLEQL